MTPDELKATAREFVDQVFNHRSLAHAEATLAEDFVEHSPPLPDMPRDKSGALAGFRLFLDASDDLRAEIVDLVSDGRSVAIRARYSGTDTGGFLPGMPPTNGRFDIEGIDVATVDDEGRFVAHYGVADVMSAMQQLGLGPSGPPG